MKGEEKQDEKEQQEEGKQRETQAREATEALERKREAKIWRIKRSEERIKRPQLPMTFFDRAGKLIISREISIIPNGRPHVPDRAHETHDNH